jgi:hypothetical protein
MHAGFDCGGFATTVHSKLFQLVGAASRQAHLEANFTSLAAFPISAATASGLDTYTA